MIYKVWSIKQLYQISSGFRISDQISNIVSVLVKERKIGHVDFNLLLWIIMLDIENIHDIEDTGKVYVMQLDDSTNNQFK